VFLVDTNVWYWMAYSRASISSRHQKIYATYLTKALAAGSRLYVSGLSQAELIHLIERDELRLFNPNLTPKVFRHDYPAERAAVVSETVAAWGVVQNIAETIDLRVDAGMTDRVINRLQICPMDGYDLMSAEAMFEHGIPQVLTDDGDFSCVSGIHIFTANPRALRTAHGQGKIVVR